MMIEVTCHVHHISALFLLNRGPCIDFRVLHAYSINNIQKQVVEYNVKSKYPEEDSTIDRVGSEKLLVKKSCFM